MCCCTIREEISNIRKFADAFRQVTGGLLSPKTTAIMLHIPNNIMLKSLHFNST